MKENLSTIRKVQKDESRDGHQIERERERQTDREKERERHRERERERERCQVNNLIIIVVEQYYIACWENARLENKDPIA